MTCEMINVKINKFIIQYFRKYKFGPIIEKE